MKIILTILILCLVFLRGGSFSYAIEDPLAVTNNKFGVHILFPEEIEEVASLVNSSGGDWGYVTIPIQAGDRDLEKWQGFMDKAKKYHIIPIIRLAIENDYFNTRVWRKPTEADIIDFANFLDSLEWPVKNRYVIVFNEVNRSDEWGGDANPQEYAQILEYAYIVFKSRSQNFFIISAGLDNASATVPGLSYNQYDFIRLMNTSVPGIFNKIDGLGSHSYPNPGFSQPPNQNTTNSIRSYIYEKSLAEGLSLKNLPVFITETGWSKEFVPEEIIAQYYKDAFLGAWNNENIVAVTPFLLRANAGPFVHFSLIGKDNQKGLEYKAIEGLPKVKGEPVFPEYKKDKNILGLQTNVEQLEIKDFSKARITKESISIPHSLIIMSKWLLKL